MIDTSDRIQIANGVSEIGKCTSNGIKVQVICHGYLNIVYFIDWNKFGWKGRKTSRNMDFVHKIDDFPTNISEYACGFLHKYLWLHSLVYRLQRCIYFEVRMFSLGLLVNLNENSILIRMRIDDVALYGRSKLKNLVLTKVHVYEFSEHIQRRESNKSGLLTNWFHSEVIILHRCT